jgi:hypothetical protein
MSRSKNKILRSVAERVVVEKKAPKIVRSPTVKHFYVLVHYKEWLGSKDSNLDCMIQSHEAEADCPAMSQPCHKNA